MTAFSKITPQTCLPDGLVIASVSECAEGGVLLAQDGVQVFARLALNCLIAPEPGDTVLAAMASPAWVIAVLARPSGAPLALRAPGDLVIAASAGSLTLQAQTLNAQAARAKFTFGEVLHVGAGITAQVARLKLIGGVLETLLERVFTRAKYSQRIISEADITRAGAIDQTAAASITLQSENTFITAANAVRVDASQIHMG